VWRSVTFYCHLNAPSLTLFLWMNVPVAATLAILARFNVLSAFPNVSLI